MTQLICSTSFTTENCYITWYSDNIICVLIHQLPYDVVPTRFICIAIYFFARHL